jgi:hypothetical protein
VTAYRELHQWKPARCSREGCGQYPVSAVVLGKTDHGAMYVLTCANHLGEAISDTLDISNTGKTQTVSVLPEDRPRPGTLL